MRLIVRNFACLKEIDVEFSDYTIFIGEQASGKSVTCKLYFFLRDTLSKNLASSFVDVEEDGWRHFTSKSKDGFYSIFPEYSWNNSDFSILLYEDQETPLVSIEYRKGNKSPAFTFSPTFKARYKSIRTTYDKIHKEIEKAKNREDELPLFGEYSSMQIFRRAYRACEFENFVEDVTFIPSGRSFFSVIRDNVFGFLSENIGIDPFLKSFGKFYEFSKKSMATRRQQKKSDVSEFDRLSALILKGEYHSDKREDWLVSEGRKIQVSSASSGQQEALPMLLGLRSVLFSQAGYWRRSIVVEEPEAHLFPSSQKAVVEVLFLASKIGSNAKFIITTHSPYVLSCVNNELLKSPVGSKTKISAYYLAKGNAHSIVDSETGLIDGSELDRISSEIADEFYAMLESAK